MTTLTRISDVDPNSLIPANYNPRSIDKSAFDSLKASLRQFGFVEPVVVNLRSGVLVGGHQRVRAAIELGMTSVPVMWVDLDETTEKALNITLNNTAISGYYTEELQVLLAELTVEMPVGQFVAVGLDKLIIEEMASEEEKREAAGEENQTEKCSKCGR
jgi:hypothetical protein